jgi:signal transduction histidine kinase/TolA-binding protein
VFRKCSILLFFAFQTSFAVGQNLHLIDSLHQQLRKARGETRYALLNDLAWEYRMAFPDSTIYYSNKGLELGEQLKLPKGAAELLNFKGIAYNYKGDRLSAYEYYDKALKKATSQFDSLQIGHSNNNLGRLFFDQGLLARSFQYFIDAADIFRKINDQSGLAYAYQSLANLYKTQKDFVKSEDNFLEAYRIRLALGNTRDIMSALIQLGRMYQDNDNQDKALKYLQLADSAGHVINDAINLAEIKTFIAKSYLNTGKLKEAEAMCAEGLEYILKYENKRMLPQAYLTMGQILLKKGATSQAKKYFSMALVFATNSKELNSKMEAHYYLWKVSLIEKDKVNELENYNQYLVIKDSIKDLELARQVERLQFEIEIERKERENESLKLNDAKNSVIIQQQKLSNIVLIILIGFVSILFFIQWRNSKKRHMISEKLIFQKDEIEKQREEIIRQNERLSKRNQELSDINHEKDTLMSIVAHDLKSPLNRIKGISEIMEIDNPLREDHRTYMRLMRDATQSGLDLITDLLDVHMLEENVEPNYTSFDISKFLFEKMTSYEPAAEAKGIHLHIVRVENEEVFLDVDYLGRIVDNLISNAIKFSKKGSTVDISGDRTDKDIWISVKDSGQGFSERDKSLLFQKFRKLSARPTAGESSNGLGLAIVKILVERMKGKIELNSELGKGSEFIVRFPLTPEQTI